MSKANEPAFPVPIHDTPNHGLMPSDYPGMTKREYFAAMAMQGMLANEALINQVEGPSVNYITQASIVMADALLAELQSEGDK